MNKEQAINYLRSSGMSNEQIESVCEGLGCAPTIVSDEAIVLDFTNITEEQKQQLVNLLSKTRIKAINKDVIWQNGYYACLNDKSIRESNWIPVSERVPNEMEDVLVWFEYADIGNILQTYGFGHVYDRDRWSPFINGRGDWKNVRIIAWMPLPEPYKETENE